MNSNRDALKIVPLEVGPLGTVCYLVTCGGEAMVIDPGGDADRILSELRERRLTVAAYLLTHGHVDHVGALADAHDRVPAPVFIHADDLRWAFEASNQLPPFCPNPRRPRADADVRNVVEGQELTLAGLTCRVIHTPGHTPGGVCYLFPAEGLLFSGDTLFAGSVGRVDLPAGNARVMSRSLSRLSELPPETRIYPGHGPDTTLSQELRSNPFLRGTVEIG